MSVFGGLLQWSRRDKDMMTFTDRINSCYSVLLLVVLASILGLSQLLGSYPLSCNTPAHFTRSNIDYAHKVCWTSASLHTLDSEYPDIPVPSEDQYDETANGRLFARLHWILLLQALLLYLPGALWRLMRRHPFIPLKTLADAGCQYQLTQDAVSRDVVRQFLGRRLGHFLWNVKKDTLTQILTLWGNYLSLAYLLTRFLYIVVVSVNIAIIARIQGLSSLGSMLQWRSVANVDVSSPHFPSIVFCSYNIRALGNVKEYSIQCVLGNNPFLQQLVVFIGCWLVFVVVINIWAFLEFFFTALFTPCCKGGVDATLWSLSKNYDNVSEFTSFLGRDGALISRLVGSASSDLVSAEMIGGAWELFNERSAGGGRGQVAPSGAAPVPLGAVVDSNIPLVEKPGTDTMYPKLA